MQQIQRILFRCYLGLMVLVLAWSLFGYAQETNAVTAAVSSSQPVDSVTTVVKVPPPSLTFGLDKIPELQRRVVDIPLWQYIASGIYIALAILAARIFRYLVSVQLRKLAARTKWTLDDMLIDLLNGPVSMLALVVLLQMGLNLFIWPAWIERWLKNGLYVLLACSLTYAVMRFADVAAAYWKRRPSIQGDKTFTNLLIPLVVKTVKAFIIIMALLLTLDNIGINIRTLLAGVSISGLALGLAAQDTVGNLFGAAAVFVDKPFQIGDFIDSNGVKGTVEEIGLRSTRLRNPDGHLITVPNKTMGNATITNITRRPNIKTVMDLGITYDTPAGKVQQAVDILREVYGGHRMTHDFMVGFNKFADSALNISVIHWWKGLDYKEYLAGLQELNIEVKRRFDEAGIGFAFPSRTVYLRQDNEWRVQTPPPQTEAA